MNNYRTGEKVPLTSKELLVRLKRPEIPSAMMRAIRQRCGFGCVVCGMPLYEYDHITGWFKTKEHIEEDITLLCKLHHGEKTARLLPEETVRAANLNPYNRRAGVSRPHPLHFGGNEFSLKIAGSQFTYEKILEGEYFVALRIDGVPIVGVRLEDGNILLKFTSFDEMNNTILVIDDNELVYKTDQWDIEWVGQSLTVRSGHRNILLKLIFQPPSTIVLSKGVVLFNGIELIIHEEFIFCSNNLSGVSAIDMVGGGLSFGYNDEFYPCGVNFSDLRRYDIDRGRARVALRRYVKQLRAIRADTLHEVTQDGYIP